MTRFNLATPGREASFRNQPGWLDGRFELFERYCLPTVAAQTNQDFSWIIYFDVNTPDRFRRRIEEAQRIRPFIAYFTGMFPSEGWRNSIIENIQGARPEFILTSVLDNDDGLSSNFVLRLQESAARHVGRAPCAINFTNGYILNRTALFRHSHVSNAFANVLEPFASEFRTASDIPHMELARSVPVIQIPGEGAWLQVVHGGNVSNKTRGRRVDRRTAERSFPVSVISNVKDPTIGEILTDTLLAAPLRSGRDKLIKVARKLKPRS